MAEKQQIKAEEKKETKNAKIADAGLTVVVRISGMVKVKSDVAETLDRMRLRRKYACVLVDGNNKNVRGMLEKVKHFVAYGPIDEKLLVELIKTKGKNIEGDKKELKIDVEKVAKDLMKGKKLEDLGLKPFFRLHPPRKGIKSKLQYPKGVLGNNKEDISKLLVRML
jgi:large subunit ribosomal protein L30